MTYNDKIGLNVSKKDLLAIVRPAIRIDTWTNIGAELYSYNFSLSSEFIEYVSNIKVNGKQYTKDSTTPTVAEHYYWDYSTRTIYIKMNFGDDPANLYVIVYFELYFSTTTTNTYRIPTDNTSEVVYYSPRIKGASIPQISNEDLLLFGSYDGSIDLINTDGAFYVYEEASFRRKEIEIYHFIDSIDDLKIIYRGNVENITKDDSTFSLSYRQIDFNFNKTFSSYHLIDNTAPESYGLFTSSDFPLLDDRFQGFQIRSIFGVVDDILPVGIDFFPEPVIDANRKWVIRADGTSGPSVSRAVANSPVSYHSGPSTHIYLTVPGGQGLRLFVGESVIINLNGVLHYRIIEQVFTAPDRISVALLPSLPSFATGDTVSRDKIGYVRIKDQDGNILLLRRGVDYTEGTFTGAVSGINCLGFTLLDNFEASWPTLGGVFNPESHKLFCRAYGAGGGIVPSVFDSSKYGATCGANYIIRKLFNDYLKIPSDQVNTVEINSTILKEISFSIPQDLSTSTTTYRDILKQIMLSTLSQIYFDSSLKLNVRLIGQLDTSSLVLTDRELISFAISYSGDEIASSVKLNYKFRESPSGSDNSSFNSLSFFSSVAKYLHEESKELEVETYLIEETDVIYIGARYATILGDWSRSYSIKTKTITINNLIGDTLTIEREKLEGFDFVYKTLRSKNLRITSIKKGINEVEITLDPQLSIENFQGGW